MISVSELGHRRARGGVRGPFDRAAGLPGRIAKERARAVPYLRDTLERAPRDGPGYRGLRFAVRVIARALFHLSATGIERLPPAGPAVLVSNHVSWLDPIILPLVLPRKPGFLAMEELWRMPGVRLIMLLYGPRAVPLERGAVDTRAFKRALGVLKSGALLIVFPEGGISRDGRLRPFHRGAALLAARAGAPMVPVAIEGTAEALPLGRVLPRARPITVHVGSPIFPGGTSRNDLVRAGEEAASQIEALLRQESSRPA